MTLERVQRFVPMLLYLWFSLNPLRDTVFKCSPNNTILRGEDDR